jgi:hypothetical protein
MEETNRVIIGTDEISAYVETFPLRTLSQEDLAKLSQDVKDDVQHAKDMLNDWIDLYTNAVDDRGTMDPTVHETLNIQWEYILNYVDYVNRMIDAELTLAASAEGDPIVITPDHITEEDVVDSSVAEYERYLDEVKTAIESALYSL